MFVSWNVNGLRAINKKGSLPQFIESHKDVLDVLCLQEIKCDDECCKRELVSKYHDVFPYVYYNTSKTKRGYSGTALLCKTKPIEVVYDLPNHTNDEGRVITAYFKKLVVINVYTPNSGADLNRLLYRTNEWDVAFKGYVSSLLKSHKNIVVCGDLNVAHQEIDVYNPKMRRCAGITQEERASFESFLKDTRMIDSFRSFHPTDKSYTFWSNLGQSRIKNNGWRIDYFLVSKSLQQTVFDSSIFTNQTGSDHAPIMLKGVTP